MTAEGWKTVLLVLPVWPKSLMPILVTERVHG